MNYNELRQRNYDRILQAQTDRLTRNDRARSDRTFGFYKGVAENGQHEVQLADGSTVYGSLVTTGAIGLGSKVSVDLSAQGRALFDAMPR